MYGQTNKKLVFMTPAVLPPLSLPSPVTRASVRGASKLRRVWLICPCSLSSTKFYRELRGVLMVITDRRDLFRAGLAVLTEHGILALPDAHES